MANTLTWDTTGTKYYETGTSKGVLYVKDSTGAYGDGVAWNGLTAVSESPGGAEETALYADDIKYASLRSAETFGATVEAYTYPDEFEECDGTKSVNGVSIGQQHRTPFGLSYVTQISNDLNAEDYKIHLVYNCVAAPSEKSYATINDSPEAITFSWEITTTAEGIQGHPELKPTAALTIDSRKVDKDKLASFEEILYGSTTAAASLPLPHEVISHFATSTSGH